MLAHWACHQWQSMIDRRLMTAVIMDYPRSPKVTGKGAQLVELLYLCNFLLSPDIRAAIELIHDDLFSIPAIHFILIAKRHGTRERIPFAPIKMVAPPRKSLSGDDIKALGRATHVSYSDCARITIYSCDMPACEPPALQNNPSCRSKEECWDHFHQTCRCPVQIVAQFWRLITEMTECELLWKEEVDGGLLEIKRRSIYEG
jgi:hypothetical protein